MQIETKWLLTIILLARCVFLAVPDTTIYPFLFSENGIPVSSYLWVNMEFLALSTIVYRWWRDTGNRSVAAFIIIVGYDWVDFLLTMNDEYLNIAGYHVTNNVVMLIAYPLLTWGIEKTGVD